jgi:hypothetical protein
LEDDPACRYCEKRAVRKSFDTKDPEFRMNWPRFPNIMQESPRNLRVRGNNVGRACFLINGEKIRYNEKALVVRDAVGRAAVGVLHN